VTAKPLKLRISTPTEPIVPGRGFYQLEEESLYVQIGPFDQRRKYFSALESPTTRLEFDRNGRLIFIELLVPRRQWTVDDSITPPKIVEPADIRWLDFRQAIADPVIATVPDRSQVRFVFRPDGSPRNFYLAESVIAQVTSDDALSSLWVVDIVDDLAGEEISAFRKAMRNLARG
jgi:hypothetical protein